MANLFSTFQERFGEWLAALGQHLQLSLLTLLVAIFLTSPLAIYLHSHKKVAICSTQFATFL
ncbi:glycine/betaine ABC transporter permease, partial [Streptococcus gordonii]|nr:glycine/betaine ABC transporter permease [Streptococcus gordonii]